MGENEERKVKPETKWSKVITELLEVIEHSLANAMKHESCPKALALEVVVGIGNVMGGQVVYLPFGRSIANSIRNKKIHEAWQAGRDVKDLAREYRLGLPTVYEIIARNRSSATK